jgi:hypothetical protein
MLTLTLIITTLLGTVQADVSLAASSSATSISNTNTIRQLTLDSFAPYVLAYTILNETSANPTWQATLNISNVKTASSWATDGKSGYFMGIGYGKKFMMNIDFTLC